MRLKTAQPILLFTLLLALTPTPRALAGGGEGGGMTGNGGNLSEQNLELAYEQLPKIINSCLNSGGCNLDTVDEPVLKRIREIAIINFNRADKFTFISGAMRPGFFDTGVDQPHRIARTGLSPIETIYFNEDVLSGLDGTHVLTIAEAAGILVHEVGHQTGSTDHRYLDKLGAKIRIRMEGLWTRDDLPLASPNIALEIFNYADVDQLPDVILTTGTQVTSVSKIVASKVACPGPGMNRLGYSVTNGHWSWPATDAQGMTSVFHAWVNVHCLNPRTGTVGTFYLDLSLLVKALKKNSDWDLDSVYALTNPQEDFGPGH